MSHFGAATFFTDSHAVRRFAQWSGCLDGPPYCSHNLTFLNRSAFVITDTDEKLIAAAAMMGLSRIPNSGYSAPAATGTPIAL